MEKKKFSFVHFCAYLSLAISITMLVLWCCNVGGFSVVSLDSFVGIIVALLAIVVTLAIGWQIYNSIEIKDRIQELSNLKEKLDLQEKTLDQQNNKSKHLIALIFGDEANKEKNYALSFSYYMGSIGASMQLDKPINIDYILKRLDSLLEKIPNESIDNIDYINGIREYDTTIRQSLSYDIIKTQYEKIYKDFSSKIKQ